MGRDGLQEKAPPLRQPGRDGAVIYPPSYQPPDSDEALVYETLPAIVLAEQGDDRYAAVYPGFDEMGVYRIVVHAEDDEGLAARPVAVEVQAAHGLYLPVLLRAR